MTRRNPKIITHTQHGAKMSPLMSKAWTYIRITRRISLTDFSTDACVERVADQLIAARDACDDPEIVRYIDCLLRRRPQTRVTR